METTPKETVNYETFVVYRLPIRDGNPRSVINPALPRKVYRLPIRDGNRAKGRSSFLMSFGL